MDPITTIYSHCVLRKVKNKKGQHQILYLLSEDPYMAMSIKNDGTWNCLFGDGVIDGSYSMSSII